MNWQVEDVYDLDMGELSEIPAHHPNCTRPEDSIDGLTPNVTWGGSRISWTNAKGQFGHHCKTGQKTHKAKASSRVERAKVLADAIGRMRTDLEDDEARQTIAAMTNEELANVVLGSGAQKLAGLKHLGEILNTGLAVPEVDDPEKCPIGQGEVECPMCGGRHTPSPVYMTGANVHELRRSVDAFTDLVNETYEDMVSVGEVK